MNKVLGFQFYYFRYYNLSISTGSCCPDNVKFSTTLYIGVDNEVETISIKKGYRNITIANEIFESSLIEKYHFCVRAVTLDKDKV